MTNFYVTFCLLLSQFIYPCFNNCLNVKLFKLYFLGQFYFKKLKGRVDISFQKKNLIHDQNTFPQCVNTKSSIQRSHLKFYKTLCYVQKNKITGWTQETRKWLDNTISTSTSKKNCTLHHRTFRNGNRQWHI